MPAFVSLISACAVFVLTIIALVNQAVLIAA
jgi:hypothetical protein